MRHCWAVLAALCFSAPLLAAPTPPKWAIATAHPLATKAGQEILEAGGNAFDAAVAVSAALAVVEPSGSGLGGGGFYLLHDARSGRKVFVDAREKAPLASDPDMYLDADGEVVESRLRSHPLAAGIPGIPAALEHLSKHYGQLALEDSLKPAQRYAEDGFEVDHKLALYIRFRAKELAAWPASAALYLPAGKPLGQGDTLVQPDLAKTLERIAVFGAAGFYQGRVANRLVEAVREAGGIWSHKDLAAYSVVERAPVIMDYRGWQIVSAPPPSSGGLVLGLMFNILSGYDWDSLDQGARDHLSVEAMRRAYYDRARFMGDSDFVDVPSRQLLSRDYAARWRKTISMDEASASAALAPVGGNSGQGRNTTHFSIIDTQGNRVAATLSINFMLGSTFVAGGTGVLLNNEMDDFVAKPGEPNGYGLVGGLANAIEPGKRMLSSMSPTFVEGADKVAIVGTPGGSRIITMVYHAINGVIDGQSARSIVAEPRFHHQYLPDEIEYEPGGLSPERRAELKKRGHSLKEMSRQYGNMQAVIWDMKRNRVEAAADPRGVGQAKTGRAAGP
ncbi:gamma-glutamyltranspeptidase [Oceanococcus atlanticus]|uniref:Glutathione hydrolase proenzyme n=1 Tax=Oceanococcus atlanticus TaxID=1317117 RepID=A0A1Y1SA85_9GAMM|nr:gamma-glutamyltransferase [Oceanococcus atlanticus]ORE85224.1 gamma-glutamyltranspeptidase [Oceanococcus atlanticus]